MWACLFRRNDDANTTAHIGSDHPDIVHSHRISHLFSVVSRVGSRIYSRYRESCVMFTIVLESHPTDMSCRYDALLPER